MTRNELHDLFLSFDNTELGFPFGEDVAVYTVEVDGDKKMFALMPEKKTPLSISVKCDPILAKLLREKYESIMEGYHLNKKHWNTILVTGQLSDLELRDLIVHSYNLVTKDTSATTPSL